MLLTFLGNSKLDSLEAKKNHLADISTGMLLLKGPAAAKSVSFVQRDTFTNDNFEKTG